MNVQRAGMVTTLLALVVFAGAFEATAWAKDAPAASTYSERVSSWWSGVKTKVAAKVEELKSSWAKSDGKPAPAGEPAPAAKTANAPAAPAPVTEVPALPPNINPDKIKPAVVSRQSTVNVPEELPADTLPAKPQKKAAKPSRTLIVLHFPKAAKLPAMPDLTPGNPVLRATPEVKLLTIAPQQYLAPKPVPAVPAFVSSAPKNEKGVFAYTSDAPLKPREKYKATISGDAPIELPKTAARKELVMEPIPELKLLNIDALSIEQFQLIHALYLWIEHRDDEALAKLNKLAVTSQDKFLQEKIRAYTGWMFDFAGYKSLAALSLSSALRFAGNAPKDKPYKVTDYDSAVIQSLSGLARETSLAKFFPDAEVIDQLTAPTHPSLTAEATAFVTLVQAERAYDRGAFATAREWALAVPEKTQWKDHARYLAAIASLGHKADKQEKKERALLEAAGRELTALFRTVEDPSLFDATAASLGHIHFLLGNYKAAHQYLEQVSRETNQFIEAAVDNGWSLLRSGDRNDAVGNMFTLHTPFFQGAYMPDSYFIQSLGYQEICQFGDAMNSIKQYKGVYSEALKRLASFNSSGKRGEADYYDDLVAFLTKKESKLPEVIVRELGRQPQFLRRQKALNLLARDERTAPGVLKISAADFLKRESQKIASARTHLKAEIGKFMKPKALALEEEMKFLTANIALLEYEIYAGAGANLALQGAKNFAIDDKNKVAAKKAEEGKEYWPYEDEVWEDELNNFRSKMVDACAKTTRGG